MSDHINHPKHYTAGKVEVIDIIEQIVATYPYPADGWCIGAALKYLARAPLKGHYADDLKKAKWYLDRVVGRHDGATQANVVGRDDHINLDRLLGSISHPTDRVPPYGNLGDD